MGVEVHAPAIQQPDAGRAAVKPTSGMLAPLPSGPQPGADAGSFAPHPGSPLPSARAPFFIRYAPRRSGSDGFMTGPKHGGNHPGELL
ncbi:hypothetical protein Slala02_05610 [Streptomyces lavendulae subsp. lavendulae]|nr:hypothetical protein Slala02_05610 [Streptomyces lavendulae subsp. lavendulae]